MSDTDKLETEIQTLRAETIVLRVILKALLGAYVRLEVSNQQVLCATIKGFSDLLGGEIIDGLSGSRNPNPFEQTVKERLEEFATFLEDLKKE